MQNFVEVEICQITEGDRIYFGVIAGRIRPPLFLASAGYARVKWRAKIHKATIFKTEDFARRFAEKVFTIIN